jgi:hypothetical protein
MSSSPLDLVSLSMHSGTGLTSTSTPSGLPSVHEGKQEQQHVDEDTSRQSDTDMNEDRTNDATAGDDGNSLHLSSMTIPQLSDSFTLSNLKVLFHYYCGIGARPANSSKTGYATSLYSYFDNAKSAPDFVLVSAPSDQQLDGMEAENEATKSISSRTFAELKATVRRYQQRDAELSALSNSATATTLSGSSSSSSLRPYRAGIVTSDRSSIDLGVRATPIAAVTSGGHPTNVIAGLNNILNSKRASTSASSGLGVPPAKKLRTVSNDVATRILVPSECDSSHFGGTAVAPNVIVPAPTPVLDDDVDVPAISTFLFDPYSTMYGVLSASARDDLIAGVFRPTCEYRRRRMNYDGTGEDLNRYTFNAEKGEIVQVNRAKAITTIQDLQHVHTSGIMSVLRDTNDIFRQAQYTALLDQCLVMGDETAAITYYEFMRRSYPGKTQRVGAANSEALSKFVLWGQMQRISNYAVASHGVSAGKRHQVATLSATGTQSGGTVCQFFNRASGCRFDASTCRLKHTCSTCGSSGHSRLGHDSSSGSASRFSKRTVTASNGSQTVQLERSERSAGRGTKESQ